MSWNNGIEKIRSYEPAFKELIGTQNDTFRIPYYPALQNGKKFWIITFKDWFSLYNKDNKCQKDLRPILLFGSQMWSPIINTICHFFIANLICDRWSDESASEADSVLIAQPVTFVVAILWAAN